MKRKQAEDRIKREKLAAEGWKKNRDIVVFFVKQFWNPQVILAFITTFIPVYFYSRRINQRLDGIEMAQQHLHFGIKYDLLKVGTY